MQYMTRKGTTGLKSTTIGAKRNMCIDKKREIDRGVGEVERYLVQPQQV